MLLKIIKLARSTLLLPLKLARSKAIRIMMLKLKFKLFLLSIKGNYGHRRMTFKLRNRVFWGQKGVIGGWVERTWFNG